MHIQGFLGAPPTPTGKTSENFKSCEHRRHVLDMIGVIENISHPTWFKTCAHTTFMLWLNLDLHKVTNSLCTELLLVSNIVVPTITHRLNVWSHNLVLVHPVVLVFNENHKSIACVRNLSCLYCTQYNTTLHVSAIRPSSSVSYIQKC
jgi:hypothetical protein